MCPFVNDPHLTDDFPVEFWATKSFHFTHFLRVPERPHPSLREGGPFPHGGVAFAAVVVGLVPNHSQVLDCGSAVANCPSAF
jgi:hypothetical protein